MTDAPTPMLTESSSDMIRKAVKRMTTVILLAAGIGFFLKAVLLSPLYVHYYSNSLYRDAWWIKVLYYIVTGGGLLDLATFALCYSATIYAVWEAGLKRSIRVPLIYAGLTVLKFVVNFLMVGITDSALPAPDDFFSVDLPVLLAQIGLELLHYILIILATLLCKRSYRNRIRTAEGMLLLPIAQRVDYPMPPPPFPFTRLLSVKNPLQLAAILSAIVLLVGRTVNHLVYQIDLYMRYGVSDGWIIMLGDFIADICIATLFYFVHLLLLDHFHKRESQRG